MKSALLRFRLQRAARALRRGAVVAHAELGAARVVVLPPKGELDGALPDALARFRADGIPATQVCVVSGGLDGIERVLQAHLRPGDRVAVEDPAFVGVRDLLAALGLVPVGVPIDDRGLIPADLRRVLATGVSALIVTPRAQNPFGSALDAERVRALAPVLARHPHLLLVEDDHAGLVSGAPALSLVDAERRDHWAVIRSFSKALGPDLRVATVAADEATHARVEGRQMLGMRWVSHLLQRVVLAQWVDRGVQSTLRAAARHYTRNREALVAALAAHGIDGHGRSGLHVWIPVPAETPVITAMLEAGWAVAPGERFRLASPPGIRACIATLEPDAARSFADDLAVVLGRAVRGGV